MDTSEKYDGMKLIIYNETIVINLDALDNINFKQCPWLRDCLLIAGEKIQNRLLKE